MKSPVPLHVHGPFSFRHGFCTWPSLVAHATDHGLPAIALTDTDQLAGLHGFMQATTGAGIRPIVGAELTLAASRPSRDRPAFPGGRVLLLVRDPRGYRHLCALLTARQLEHPEGVPVERLLELGEGLTCLTGDRPGPWRQLLQTRDHAAARQHLLRFREAFGAEHLWVQLGLEGPRATLAELAGATGVGLVAAPAMAIDTPGDRAAWRLWKLAHGQGEPPEGPHHLLTPTEWREGFRDWPDALEATHRIAEACRFVPETGVWKLPRFPLVAPGEAEALFVRLVEDGLERRYGGSPRAREARERLERELAVIRHMGFVDYFLLAWDLVREARARGVPVLPRGSAAGSLVLYLLGCSDVCPLEHVLCFERFLNPERRGLPDIDLDFDWRRRDDLVEYCFRTYGADRVARIATHQHVGARGAVRLAGAALGLEERLVGEVARRMPGWSGGGDLATAIARSPECRDLDLTREPVRSLVRLARRFEGRPEHLGLHPCGIVIADRPLVEVLPLARSAKGPVVTQLEMHGVEALGLLKMDLLGNRNLAVLSDALELVRDRHGLETPAERLPLDDPAAFELLGRGRTLGIYQMESGGVQALLRQFQPAVMEDVTAITSLYRPGPLDGGITPRYIARRHGREAVESLDPSLDEVLAHTYGCILYQEQCMQVTHVFAGLGMGQCDNLRRGIAKRIRPEVERLRASFLEGARGLGRDPATIDRVWELLSHFGGYGFVKAHAAACASLAVREAHLKARWPLEYLAAVLSSGMGYYPMRVYVEDARSSGAAIALPCVNRSTVAWTLEGDRTLRVGLSAIAGLGTASIEALLSARATGGPFRSLADLRARTRLARPELETLVRVGACDGWGQSRIALVGQLAFPVAGARAVGASVGQGRLFALEDVSRGPTVLAPLGDYGMPERQAIERELLGFVVTDASREPVVGAVSFRELVPGTRASVVGEIVARHSHRTRQGEKMVFLTLSDGLEQLQAVVFPRVYARLANRMRSGEWLFSGRVGDEQGQPVLVVDDVERLNGS